MEISRYRSDKRRPVPQYCRLVYTTQVNSTFRARWLASSELEVISQVLFTPEQPKKPGFWRSIVSLKLLLGQLVIQVVWCKLKQLFTSVSVNNWLINSRYHAILCQPHFSGPHFTEATEDSWPWICFSTRIKLGSLVCMTRWWWGRCKQEFSKIWNKFTRK